MMEFTTARSLHSRLSDLVPLFQKHSTLTGTRQHARCKAAIVRGFLWSAHILVPEEITESSVRGHLAHRLERGRSLRTVRNDSSAISTFCDFLMSRGLLQANPCARIRLPRPERTVPLFLAAEEIAEVLPLADEKGIGNEVRLALGTGMRLNELRCLEWQDVLMEKRIVLVRKTKARQPRAIPISQLSHQALQSQSGISGTLNYVFPTRHTYRNGSKVVDAPRSKWWWVEAIRPVSRAVPKFALAASGSTGCGWHLFRKTFASQLAQAGVSIFKIAAWLGHSSVSTTERFYAILQIAYDADIERM